MYLVKAKNKLNNREFKAQFDTEQEANDWIQRQLKKQSWGKNARQAVRGQDIFDESLVESEREETDPESNITRVIVSLRAEFDYEGPTFIDGSGTSEEDKELRKKKALKKVAKFRKFKNFGQDVELFFTALVNERDLTQEQKDSIQEDSDVLKIKNHLNFGRVGKAKKLIKSKQTDDVLFFKDDLDAVLSFIEDFLTEL